jgi:hypothetical protein
MSWEVLIADGISTYQEVARVWSRLFARIRLATLPLSADLMICLRALLQMQLKRTFPTAFPRDDRHWPTDREAGR